MTNLSAALTLILSGLRAAIGAHLARRDPTPGVVWLGTRAFVSAAAPPTTAPPPIETWTLLWTRLGRIAARFQALFNHWRAATLPKPRAPRPGRPPSPAAPRLPMRRTWIVAAIGYQAAGRASQLNALLAEPDMAEFLAAVPRAGRLLRPLCHMLGITPTPAALARPPRMHPLRTHPAPAPAPLPQRRRTAPHIPPPLLPLRKNPA